MTNKEDKELNALIAGGVFAVTVALAVVCAVLLVRLG
jgi:hypothetical protein